MTVVDPGIADYDDLVEVGRGTFAVVYQARQRSFDRPVAIKVLPAPRSADGQQRFRRECEAIGRLSGHPGIVTVYDASTGSDGRCYLVMELLTGGSLAELLAGVDRLDVDRVLRIGVSLAGAIESAHRAGVVHGDVKPENILLSRFGDPKLADFGLATLRSEAHDAGSIAGTLSYSAPELLAGNPPTPATDVYALAATLHTLLAGQPPFASAGEAGVASLAAAITTSTPDDLRPRGVPEALSRVLLKGLAKEPSDRQATAGQLGRQLQAVQAAAGHNITPLLVEEDEGPGAPDQTTAAPHPHRRRWPARSRLVGAILLVAGVIGLSGPSPGATSAHLSPLYQDDFETGQGWFEQDDGLAAIAYDSGAYRMHVKRPGIQYLSDTAFRGPVYGKPMTGLGDVSVRVSAKPESGTGLFGIVCRQAERRVAFYEGLLGVDGTARIVRYRADRLDTLVLTHVAAPPPGQPVRLRLDCAGGTGATRLRLFVDGRSVADVVDHHGLAAGSTGLATATAEAASATVTFDDFVILGRTSDTS